MDQNAMLNFIPLILMLVIETSSDNTKIEVMKWGVNGTYKKNADLKDAEEE